MTPIIFIRHRREDPAGTQIFYASVAVDPLPVSAADKKGENSSGFRFFEKERKKILHSQN
jgi:hypothetical protein